MLGYKKDAGILQQATEKESERLCWSTHKIIIKYMSFLI